MKLRFFFAIFAVFLASVTADEAASNVTEAASFLIKAQGIFNDLEGKTYDEAVLSASLANKELQRLSDAIQDFKTEVLAQIWSFKDPVLPVATAAQNVEGLLGVVQDRMDRFDFGSQIIAVIVDFNNQVGVLVSSKIEIFYSYKSSGGDGGQCFTNEIPRINDESSEVVDAIKAALEKLIDDKAGTVDAWVEKIADALAQLEESDSLSEIDSTVTALVAEGLSNSFWLEPLADLRLATQAIIDDAGNTLELIKNDIETCIDL